jgi:hypothetical protein
LWCRNRARSHGFLKLPYLYKGAFINRFQSRRIKNSGWRCIAGGMICISQILIRVRLSNRNRKTVTEERFFRWTWLNRRKENLACIDLLVFSVSMSMQWQMGGILRECPGWSSFEAITQPANSREPDRKVHADGIRLIQLAKSGAENRRSLAHRTPQTHHQKTKETVTVHDRHHLMTSSDPRWH